MRVRESFGLKFPDELKENGSARIDTDSITTARVDVDDRVKTEGAWLGKAVTIKEPPTANAIKLAHTIETM